MANIFVAAGGRVKRGWWTGKTFDDLVALYYSLYYEEEGGAEKAKGQNALPRSSFHILDPKFGILCEGFGLDEIIEGSLIEVYDPIQMKANDGKHTHYSPNYTPADTAQFFRIIRSHVKAPVAVSPQLNANAFQLQPGKLSVRERLWLLLESPDSSKQAAYVLCFFFGLILISTMGFILETLPHFYVHDSSTSSKWFIMEATCISAFTFEIFLRVACCPSVWEYFKSSMNLVDILAILPFYCELVLNDSVPGLAVLRAVRLMRIFRLFKGFTSSLNMISKTVTQSAKPLYMNMFITMLIVIVSSSLLFYVERGVWDDDLKNWKRVSYYVCRILVESDPNVVVDSSYVVESGHSEAPCVYSEESFQEGLALNQGYFDCPFSFDRNDSCYTVYEPSPFASIPHGCWWCLASITCVGYGDISPTSLFGKGLGCVVMVGGIVMLSLPISVVGRNLSRVQLETNLDEGKRKKHLE
ncbi:hypothetical protein CYMTET_21188 [Cymbomonas tetramitiformis]|uniref:Ion transport domain-containing protein n=1 Tax=Cymbomonas tetramitiformis TaxID=36881 RepID=A0AAE0G317_9CHLO|nr:hypothetical protein CYMTET_21188 [Cymbomonas tetramitiformis]